MTLFVFEFPATTVTEKPTVDVCLWSEETDDGLALQELRRSAKHQALKPIIKKDPVGMLVTRSVERPEWMEADATWGVAFEPPTIVTLQGDGSARRRGRPERE